MTRSNRTLRRNDASSTIFAVVILSVLSGGVKPARAQNLVLNGSFENNSGCPDDWSQFPLANYWLSPTAGTPDYYHRCSTSTTVAVPTNGSGVQEPSTGDAYAGLYVDAVLSGGDIYREYIIQRLATPLTNGQVYVVGAMVSRADEYRIAVDSLGIYVSTQPPTSSGGGVLSVVPQIRPSPGLFLKDANNWMQISGTYFAQGGEQWITIGSFEGASQSTLNADPSAPIARGYYYIDDVTVCSPGAAPSFYVPPGACEGNPIPFDGSASQNEDLYQVEVCRSTARGSHEVTDCLVCKTSISPVPSAPIDLVTECPPGYFTPGDYRVKLSVSNFACGVLNDQYGWVKVFPQPCCLDFALTVTPPGPVVGCLPITLTASVTGGGGGSATFEWYRDNILIQNGPAELDVTESGEYYILATDASGCWANSFITVTVQSPRAEFMLPLMYCRGDPLLMDASPSEQDAEYRVEVYQTDDIGSDVVVGGQWTTGWTVGPAGIIDLNAEYPFSFVPGGVYRISLSARNGTCPGEDTKVHYMVATCCGNSCADASRSCIVPPADMIAWWPLDEQAGTAARDIRGGHDGVRKTQAILPIPLPGWVCYGLEFPSPGRGYVEVPDEATLDLGTGDFTIDAWLLSPEAGGCFGPIVSKHRTSGSPRSGFVFYYPAGPGAALEIIMRDTGNFFGRHRVLAPGLNDGAWHHVAVTVDRDDPNGIQFYMDGQPLGAPGNPTNVTGSLGTTEPLYLGTFGLFDFYLGSIDEVDLFRRALNAGEIQAIYAAGTAGKCKDAVYVPALVDMRGRESIDIRVSICNGSTSPATFSYTVAGLPRDGSANVDGPTSADTTYIPDPPELMVAAGKCASGIVRIARPADEDFFFSSRYVVTVTSQSDQRCFSAVGTLSDTLGLPVDSGGGYLATARDDSITVVDDGTRTAAFDIQNTTAQTATLPYVILPVPQNGDPNDSSVSLDGNPAGQQVSGSVTLFPDESTTVSVDVTDAGHRTLFGWHDVILLVDSNTDGLYEPASAIGVRRVRAPVCPQGGDLDHDGDVDGSDFAFFLLAFGQSLGDTSFNADADLDGDGVITFVDYQHWLQCYRSFVSNPLAPPPMPEGIGDMDGSGTVDGSDIQPFVDAMLVPATAGFRARFMADANGDGAVDSADVGEFVGMLLSQQ